MAHTWGPIERPEHHDVKPIAAQAEGTVTEPHEDDRNASAPGRSQNYNATDGRHNKADHEGWTSIDPKSGKMSEVNRDTWESDAKFPDGPGRWRQT